MTPKQTSDWPLAFCVKKCGGDTHGKGKHRSFGTGGIAHPAPLRLSMRFGLV